jgi:hypothetical protein
MIFARVICILGAKRVRSKLNIRRNRDKEWMLFREYMYMEGAFTTNNLDRAHRYGIH